jgi:hypothetical protein
MSSELLAAAAEAMGIPEAMVQRSAEARAGADGISLDEVLAAWSGGGTITPAAPVTAPEPAPEPTPADTIDQPAEPAPVPVAAPPLEPVIPVAAPSAVTVGEAPAPEGSPVLEGRRESWVVLLAGSIGLFLVAALFAFVLPALDATPETAPPTGLSALGLEGREIYVSEGCWYCHTQQVRPIVTDARLGPVSQSDLLASFAPDTLGIQRIGPDLAHVGSREPTNDATWLTAFLTDPQSVREDSLQPEYDHLSQADLQALVQYLLESR